MFNIDQRLFPPIIEQTSNHLAPHVDSEVLRRRALFANALAGNEEARAILRNTYRLTHCVINGRDILNGQQKHKKKTATPKQ